MKRRQFLGATAGGIVLLGLGVGTGTWLLRPEHREPRSAIQTLATLAESMSGVAEVGHAWREANDNADPAELLLETLALDGETVVAYDDFIQQLGNAVASDLDEGRLFVHEGWWLAETEARLAGLHVALLGPEASEPVEHDFDTADEGTVLAVRDFTPGSMNQGESISHHNLPENVIWFATRQTPPPRLRLMLAGTLLPISTGDRGFSVRVTDSVLGELNAAPGDHEIWLYDPVARRKQSLGTFHVQAAGPDEAGFCVVTGWGPTETSAGEVFNPQPDGSAAFWVQSDCFPEGSVLLFDGVELPTTLHPDDGLITARVVDAALYAEPGEYSLELVDQASGRRHAVGTFTVNE